VPASFIKKRLWITLSVIFLLMGFLLGYGTGLLTTSAKTVTRTMKIVHTMTQIKTVFEREMETTSTQVAWKVWNRITAPEGTMAAFIVQSAGARWMVIFNSSWYSNKLITPIRRGAYSEIVADEGYKLYIINVTVVSLNVREESFPMMLYTEIKTDLGYYYAGEQYTIDGFHLWSWSIRPGEREYGYLVFEIPSRAKPLELLLYGGSPPMGSPDVILKVS